MIDLSRTVAPKSDQLNADDLIAGPRTIVVTAVKLVAEDQPVAINFAGDDGKPYKPCKSMRRLMIKAWGPDGAQYVGKSMTLYLDESVRFGGAAVGGIRISHMSHLDKPLTMALTATRAVKKAYTVKPLEMPEAAAKAPEEVDRAWIDDIRAAENLADLKVTFGAAWKAARNPVEKTAFKAAYDKLSEELTQKEAA